MHNKLTRPALVAKHVKTKSKVIAVRWPWTVNPRDGLLDLIDEQSLGVNTPPKTQDLATQTSSC